MDQQLPAAKLDTAKIEAFLSNTLKRAGLSLKFQIGKAASLHSDFENPELVVKFSGADVDLLLSNKAELLLALEQLTMEMLRLTANEHSLIQFDANDYRMLRIEELRLSALTVAEKVKKSRVPFEFNPMNSRERRIITTSPSRVSGGLSIWRCETNPKYGVRAREWGLIGRWWCILRECPRPR